MKVNMRHIQLQSIPRSSKVIILQKLKKSPQAFRQSHGYMRWLVLSAKNSFGCCLNHCPTASCTTSNDMNGGVSLSKDMRIIYRKSGHMQDVWAAPISWHSVGHAISMPHDDGNGHAATWYPWRVYPDIYSWPWYSYSDIYDSKCLHYLCHHVTWCPAARDPGHFSGPVGMDSSPSTPSLNRDAQIPGTRPLGRQNFVQWYLTLVGS